MAIGDNAERIKILRVIGRLNIGGPAIHVVNLTAGLDARRYRSLLVAGSENEAEGSMLDFALSQGVRPAVIAEIVTAFSLAPRDLKALWKLYSLMRRERPHIVHTHTAKAGFLGRIAARLAGVPVIIHTFHGHVLHGYYGALKNELLRRLERWLARMSDRLVTVSEQVKAELVGYAIAPADKITVVPLGFDLEPFLNIHREIGFTTKDTKSTKEEKTGFTTETQSTQRFGKAFCEEPPTLTEPPRLGGAMSESDFAEGREDCFHRRDTEFAEVRRSDYEKPPTLTEPPRLRGEKSEEFIHHRDAEFAEVRKGFYKKPLPLTDSPRLRGATIGRGEFRREMGLSDEHKLIGIVGRIFPIKNHALFLDSAARIAAEDAAARFVIVGDGILRPSLEIQAKQLGIADRVLFTGWRSDLPRICADLDVLVVSSDNEGTPVSAIEAMAAGCPVVATRVGGLPDLIDDGRTGRLVPPRNAEALARAVLDVLRNPKTARELGDNGREFVRQRFTIERLLGDMDRLYSELLAAKEEKMGYTAEAPFDGAQDRHRTQRFGKILTKNLRL